MSSEQPVEQPRRLHPAGIAVLGVGALRSLAFPLGIAFAGAVAGGSGGKPIVRALIFGAFGALLAVAAGVAGWLTTRWSVGPETIRLRTGLLSRKEVDIPIGRVQAIDIVQGPIQRLFGVRGVHVQTAGGSREGEITLPAVADADVELLRAALRRRRAGPGPEPTEPAAPLAERRLSRRRLLLAALTAGQVGVILPVLAAVPQLLQEVFGGDLRSAGREGMRIVPSSPPEWILAAVALLLLAWLLSTAGAVIAFAGFTIARDEDRLRIRRGLLAHREATVPIARVQAVRVVEGTLRQPFGLVAVRAEVAGYAKEPAAAQTLFPLLRREEVEPFLAAILPGLADRVDGLEGAPRRALRRYILPLTAFWLAAGAAASLLVPGAGLWPLLAAIPAALLGAARWSAAGWRVEHGRVAVRFRRLARVTVLTRGARLQQHGLRQTVLQRWGRLADVELRVGAATRARVRHLEAAVAGRVFDALRHDQVVRDAAGARVPRR
jgi:putative membrane protein